MKRPFLGLVVITACLIPALASAQEAGKVGVTMGFPASVGVIWHTSEKIAVRPEFSFTHSSTDSRITNSNSDTVALGVSVLFYTKKWDNAAMYLAPRFSWSHGSSESETDDGDFESSSSGDSYTYSGSVGAQGWIGSRFSVFGEVGLSYGTASSESDNPFSSEIKNQSFTIRSGVGVVLYF